MLLWLCALESVSPFFPQWGAAGACGLAVVDGGDLVVACAVAVCGVSVIVVGVREGV